MDIIYHHSRVIAKYLFAESVFDWYMCNNICEMLYSFGKMYDFIIIIIIIIIIMMMMMMMMMMVIIRTELASIEKIKHNHSHCQKCVK